MNGRPRIKLKLTVGDSILELLGWFSLFLLWYMITINYNKLPEIVPVHYNVEGKVDKVNPIDASSHCYCFIRSNDHHQ